jgi:plasmid stabilization system protein ParE
MKRPSRITRQARTDLRKNWNYLAEHASFEVADKVIADIRDGIEQIEKSPGIGHERPDLTPLPVRFYLVHRYLIIYTQKPSLIVVRILHAARDISSVLSSNG